MNKSGFYRLYCILSDSSHENVVFTDCTAFWTAFHIKFVLICSIYNNTKMWLYICYCIKDASSYKNMVFRYSTVLRTSVYKKCGFGLCIVLVRSRYIKESMTQYQKLYSFRSTVQFCA